MSTKIHKDFAAVYLLLPHIKAFLKQKKRSGTSHSASFSVQFLEKKIFLTLFLTLCSINALIRNVITWSDTL